MIQQPKKRASMLKATTNKIKRGMIKFSPSPSPGPPLHSNSSDTSPKPLKLVLAQKHKIKVSKQVSPCSAGSGSSIEDEATAGTAKVGVVHTSQVQAGASQSYLTNRAPAHHNININPSRENVRFEEFNN